MQIIRLWNYLRGYVIIEVEGLTLERFLNLASTRDIYLWDIKRMDYTVLKMKVSIEGFKALKEVVKKAGCKLEIIDKNGVPFLLYRLKHRKMLGFGFLLFLFIIIFLFSLIWQIEIIGNETIKAEKIIQALEEENIKQGIIKYKIDKDYTRDFLLDRFDFFSFVSLEIKGSKLIVEIKEQDRPPESIDIDTPCNIVATKKGIIIKTIAKNGNSLVRKGDVVEEGQVLITGIISDEDPDTDDIFVHAEGEVLAKTIYTYRMEKPIIKTIKEETGRLYESYELRFGKRGIQFSKDNIPFENYIEDVKKIKLFHNKLDLPLKVLVHEYKEVEVKEIKQNIDFLKKDIHIKAIEEINKQLVEKLEIESKDVKYTVDEEMLSIHIVVEAVEDIGKKKVID